MNDIVIPKGHRREHLWIRDEIRKLRSSSGSSGSGDFSNLTEEQAVDIANAITNLNVPSIRLYGYNVDWLINILANDSVDILLKDTGGTEKTFYLETEFPLELKVKEDFTPQLANGEYIYISYGDNQTGNNFIAKSLTQGQIIASNLGTSAYLQLQKQNFGNDLVLAAPYNFEIDNQTTHPIEFGGSTGTYISTPRTSEDFSVQPYTNWDYVYPRLFLDTTGFSNNVVVELWKANDSQRVYTRTLSPNNQYNNYYMGQARFSSYSTRDYKIVVKNQ